MRSSDHPPAPGNPALGGVHVSTIGADSLERQRRAIFVKMTEKAGRAVSQGEAMTWIRSQMADMADVKTSVEMVDVIGGGSQRVTDIELEIRGAALDRLEAAAGEVMDFMNSAGGYVDIDTSYEKNKPQVVREARPRADLGRQLLRRRHHGALIGGDDVAFATRRPLRCQRPAARTLPQPPRVHQPAVRNNRANWSAWRTWPASWRSPAPASTGTTAPVKDRAREPSR